VKSLLNKIPREGGHNVGEAFCRFVPGPSGRDPGNRSGLEQVEGAIGKPPLDVLGKATRFFHVDHHGAELFELALSKARLLCVDRINNLFPDALCIAVTDHLGQFMTYDGAGDRPR